MIGEEVGERLLPLSAGAGRARGRVEREQRALEVAARRLGADAGAEVAADASPAARISPSATFAAHGPSGAGRSTRSASGVAAPIVIAAVGALDARRARHRCSRIARPGWSRPLRQLGHHDRAAARSP